MQVSIGNLMITSFCAENIKHQKFRFDLAHDEVIYDFVSTNIYNDLVEVVGEDVRLECSYIIQDNDKLVGYIDTKIILNEEGIIELRYAVHPKYRRLGYLGYSDSTRKGYGEQILEECSSYLFNFDNVNSIDLHIRKDNVASIGCAKKAKFKCIGTNEDEYYFIYRCSRGDIK